MLYLLRSEVGLQILMFAATGLQIQSNRENEVIYTTKVYNSPKNIVYKKKIRIIYCKSK